MSCNTALTSILKGCNNNIGGLAAFYIAPSEFVTGSTVSAGTVTAVNMSGATKFVTFEFNKNGGNYIEAAPISLENGSTYFEITVNLTIPRREVAKRNAIALLAAGQRNLDIIVLDQNGLYWYIGYANGANLTALGEGSGVSKADGSKYSLTFLAEEPELAYEVTSGIIANIIS